MGYAITGATIASSLAILFAASGCGSDSARDAPSTEQQQAQGIKCEGINACKGQSECQSSDGKSSCQGLNDCKGQGWITVPTLEECKEKGGHLYGEAGSTSASIHCYGANACKGQGECASKENACKGQNTCKGHSFIIVPSEQACEVAGGTTKSS